MVRLFNFRSLFDLLSEREDLIEIRDGKVMPLDDAAPNNMGKDTIEGTSAGNDPAGPGQTMGKDLPEPPVPMAMPDTMATMAEPTATAPIDPKDEAPNSQEEENIPAKRGRLPSDKKFFVYLETAGRSKRTLQEYSYELKFWKNAARKQLKSLYELKIDQMEFILKNLDPSTRARKVSFLKTYANWLNRSGKPNLMNEARKLPSIKAPKRLPKDLGAERFVELRELSKEWVRQGKRQGLWLALMLMAGLRISEITTAYKSGPYIKVMGKGQKERLIPAPDWIFQGMEQLPPAGRLGWRKNRQIIWKVLADNGIRKPHSLRHTYASQLLRKGRKIEEIQLLLGHTSISTTTVYLAQRLPLGIVDDLDN